MYICNDKELNKSIDDLLFSCFRSAILEPKTPQKKQNEFYTNEGIIITLKTGSITTETVSCNRAREHGV